ncbi:MAG TPA: hypothetical protein PKZ49_12055, partial [Nitrosomonas sp.]|nr:hypothetical protein [Nitrosomonas sp.]
MPDGAISERAVYPAAHPDHPRHIGSYSAGMCDHILPITMPLPPASNSPFYSLHTLLQISSSWSPVATPSVSFEILLG